MATEFKLPELGENIESGDLVRLMIKPGGSITEGEPVMELETDKAVVEVPSSVTGTIGEVSVQEGDKLRGGQVIFTVENGSGAGTSSASKAEKTAAQASPTPAAPAPASRTPAVRAPANPAPAASAPAIPVSETTAKPARAAAPQRERRATTTASVATASEFRLPELGENIDSGDLVRLMISPGASVAEGQPVMELETDKAVVEVPSTVSGVVREVKVKEGQKVKVGKVIFTLEGGVVAPAESADKRDPVEHVSGQQAARLAFQLAMRAEGKTEEQALPPDQPQSPPPD